MSRILLLFTFVLLLSSQAAVSQEATPEDFKKLCNDLKGRWVGDVTWITDWPGLGKKGDKVTGYWEGKVTQDGQLLEGRFFGGNGSDKMLAYYDPAAKRIRAVSVDSGGSIINSIFYRDGGNKWINDSKHIKKDGTTGKLKEVGTITDGGKTWTWVRNGKIGDDEVKDQKDVWRRVSDK